MEPLNPVSMPYACLQASTSCIIRSTECYYVTKSQKNAFLSAIMKSQNNRKEVLDMSILKVNANNFNEVIHSEKPVLLDFYADWCGPCQIVSPVVDEIAKEYPEYLVGKINVDEQMELAAKFGVSSIPLLIVMKDGKIVNHALGARPKDAILSMLQG